MRFVPRSDLKGPGAIPRSVPGGPARLAHQIVFLRVSWTQERVAAGRFEGAWLSPSWAEQQPATESLEAVDQTRRESWYLLIKALAGKEDEVP